MMPACHLYIIRKNHPNEQFNTTETTTIITDDYREDFYCPWSITHCPETHVAFWLAEESLERSRYTPYIGHLRGCS